MQIEGGFAEWGWMHRAELRQCRQFYSTKKWKTLREETLGRYGTVCMRCGKENPTMVVDHIRPLRRHWELRLDPENVQVLCVPCNVVKGNTEEDCRPGMPRHNIGVVGKKPVIIRRRKVDAL